MIQDRGTLRTPHRLVRDGNFVLFWTARTISLFGTSITAVVLPILVYKTTGSSVETSLITTLDGLPYILFGMIAGAVADRQSRRRLMIGSDLLNAVLMASLPAVYYLHHLTIGYIYIIAICSATAFVWFDAANFGAIRALAGAERVITATTSLMATETVVSIGGLAVGGVLAAAIGPVRAIIFDAVSYLISAILISFIRVAFNVDLPRKTEKNFTLRQLIKDILIGIKFIWGSRIIRILTAATVGVTLAGGAVGGLTVVYAVRGFRLAETDPRIGVMYACGATGSFLSSLVLPRLQRHVRAGIITLVGLGLNFGLLVGLATVPTLSMALATYMLWEATYTIVTLNGITIRTRITPDSLQGRVNAAGRTVAWGGAPIGAAIGGVLSLHLGIRSVFFVMSLAVLACLLLAAFCKAWSLNTSTNKL